MATVIVIACPQCKKQMKATADLQGKRVKCKGCGKPFLVQVPGEDKANPGAKPASPPAGANKAGPTAKGDPSKPAAPAAKANVDEDDDGPAVYGFIQPAEQTTSVKANTKKKKGEEKEPEEKVEQPPKRVVMPGEEDDVNPYLLTELDETYRCPQCAYEMDGEDAVICLNCGYNTQTRQINKTIVAIGHTPFERTMWLLPGVICAVVFFTCIAIIIFLWGFAPRLTEKYPDAWWTWLYPDALPTQIYGTVIGAGIGWKTLQFAIKRLIKNPSPPIKLKKSAGLGS